MLTMLLFGAVAALAACGGDGGPPADPQVRQSVGAAGGMLSTADGAFTLTIPAGALANDTEITIIELAAARQPDGLKALNADKVYRLEPSGLVFVVPATASVTLPASNALAVIGIGSETQLDGGTGEQTLKLEAGQRRLTAQIPHFSFVVVKSLNDLTLQLELDRREASVGSTVTATATLSKEATETEIHAEGFWNASGALTLSTGTINPREYGDFNRAAARLVEDAQLPSCSTQGLGEVSLKLRLSSLAFNFGRGPEVGAYAGSMSLAVDVSCVAASPPPDAIATGVFEVPFLRHADGVQIIHGPVADIPTGAQALFAGDTGAVAIDLRNGLSVLNMTASGPNGSLGLQVLLDALMVSQPGPGASTPAALFGTGAAGALRNWLPGSGWSATQVIPWPIVQSSAVGGGLVADEILITGPNVGLNFIAFDGNRYALSTERADALLFDGTLVSAVQAFAAPASQVLVATKGSNGGTTSTLWRYDRQSGQATPLFVEPDPNAGQISCSPSSAGLPSLCDWELSDGALVFSLMPFSTAVPTPTRLASGGAVRGEWNLDPTLGWTLARALGRHGLISMHRFDAAAVETGSAKLPLPPECAVSFHVQPVDVSGESYGVGTCDIDTPAQIRARFRF